MAENIENKNFDNGADESNQQQQTKTYTEEEVLALIQSEADKRVSQALKTQQKKYEKQLSLSGLDEAERTKKEKDLRIQELEEQIKEFNLIKNKNEIVKVLTARKLNPAFADLNYTVCLAEANNISPTLISKPKILKKKTIPIYNTI